MIKVLFTAFLLAFMQVPASQNSSDETYVYMCVNGKTEVYHVNRQCRGMKQCKHTIKKLTLEAAKAKELRLCGWED
ncbi:MAG: hypothetical protein HRT58_00325 [Crocinitomicaceae bacterium]|nr:hypothetical protein [Flavobacteriales bacterium]NQZ34066.1 hypothetical protein [Crocinitomicaceae bacterium]